MTADDASGVRHNPDASRFELDTPSGLAVADYVRADSEIRFTHTEVPGAERGKGYGDLLAKAALDHARQEDLQVVPQCPFIADWMRRHPEYEDLRA